MREYVPHERIHTRIRTRESRTAHSHSRVQAARRPHTTKGGPRLTRRKQKKTHGARAEDPRGPDRGPRVPARGAATRVQRGRRAKMRVASRRKIVNITSASAVLPPRVFLLGIFRRPRATLPRAIPRPGARDPPHLAVGKTTHTEHARRRHSN